MSNSFLSFVFITEFFENLYVHYLHSYTKQVIDEVITLVLQLLPYLIVGIIISAAIKTYISFGTLKRVVTGRNLIFSVIVAAILGIVSPLGSYVVIPVSAALVTAGVPLAPVVAFMVSSPLINPGLFMITWGSLGLEMAILRCVSALALGLCAGIFTLYLNPDKHNGIRNNPLQSDKEAEGLIKKRTFLNEALAYTKYISKYFFLGIFIAALTKVFVPIHWIAYLFGQNLVLSVFAATAAGVPLYSCGGAAIPVMKELADMGVDKGAILAFLISGPATKITNVVMLTSLYKRGVVVLYFALSIIGAILFGIGYHFF